MNQTNDRWLSAQSDKLKRVMVLSPGRQSAPVDFEGAILINADFKEADLRQASFDEANLKGAELDGADMRGANLGTAFGLTNSQIAQACIDKSTVLPLNVLSATTRSGACNDLDPN